LSVVDAFLATWSDARATFGQGTPDTGAKFDQSGPLLAAQTNVQSAAPGSTWSGRAASAYGTANTEHGAVLGQIAGLDQRLSGQVNQSSQVVAAGRRDLDALRQWVIDAASAVPPGKNRDQMLAPIVQDGLSRLTDIVSKSNGDLSKIGGEIRALDAEFRALANQRFVKEGPGDGALGVKGDEEEKKKKDIDDSGDRGHEDGDSLSDGKLSSEESARLQGATTLTHEEKAALDRGDLTIPPERMAYLNGLSDSLDGKSPAEIKATVASLPPEDAKAVSNALHLVGSDAVKTSVDPSIKPGEDGYVPATGSKENLPKSIQDIFDAPLKNSPVPEQVIDPNGKVRIELPDLNEPYKFLDEYRDIAAISNHSDADLQRGSAINEGMLAESRELLEDYDSDHRPNPGLGPEWGQRNVDPTLQDVLSAASHDPVAVHDAFAGQDGKSPNNDFIGDVYQHDWADDGKAAGELFPETSDHSERAGQTMHAFDAYAGVRYQDLLNMSGTDSLGQVNPELVRALGDTNVPYLDDMAGSNLDGTKGFDRLDGGANGNDLRGLFAVIDSDDTAGNNFNAHAANTFRDYIADYSQGLANGGVPQGELLESVGRLQGAMDMGQYIHELDSGKDGYEASKAAWEKKGEWYDVIHDTASEIPRLKEAVGMLDKMPGDPLRDLFVGEAPEPGDETPMKLRELDDITRPIAAYLVEHEVGDLSDLKPFINDKGQLDWNNPAAQNYIDAYVSEVQNNNDLPQTKWAYEYLTSILVSEGEFDKIKSPEG